MTKELQVIKYVLVYSKKYAEEFLNDTEEFLNSMVLLVLVFLVKASNFNILRMSLIGSISLLKRWLNLFEKRTIFKMI